MFQHIPKIIQKRFRLIKKIAKKLYELQDFIANHKHCEQCGKPFVNKENRYCCIQCEGYFGSYTKKEGKYD